MKRLSAAMERTLQKLKDAPNRTASAYDIGESLATLMALRDRGLVLYRQGIGSFFSPRTIIRWTAKEGMG